MLELSHVTKRYGDVVAISDISFKLDQGEFAFLIGPSGAGKSTIFRLVIREEKPTEGEIKFREMEVEKIPSSLISSFRQKMGVVFQDYKLLESKTIRENIGMVLEITNQSDKEIGETVDFLLDRVGILDRGNLFPRQLSGGEKQRAVIARALANDPDLLIADEPTGHLDPDNAWGIIDLLERINKSGTTVLVSTHSREMVDQLNRRVILMNKGKLISDEKKGKYVAPAGLKKLGISDSICKRLDSVGIKSVEEVLDLSEEDLISKGNLTKGQCKELISKIEESYS